MGEFPSLRVIFAGTPTFAAEHLQAILKGPHQVIAVYTQPDRPAGRGKKLTPSPVKQLALEYGLPVYQPERLKSPEEQQILADLEADIMVVVAYGLILPEVILNTPRLGCINVHASLLPRWRGAAPIQRAIEAGDDESGITIMQMDVGLDTGPMLKKIPCAICDDDTSDTLFNKLSQLGCATINDVLNEVSQQSLTPEAQNNTLATYADKISKAEAEINWQESAELIARKIRAFNPFPIAYTESSGERLKIYRATIQHVTSQSQNHSAAAGTLLTIGEEGIQVACGEGSLLIQDIQLPNKKAMSVQAVLLGNRNRFNIGDIFTASSTTMLNPTAVKP